MELVKIPLDGNEQALVQICRDVYADTPERIPSEKELRWRFGCSPYPVRIWVARDGNKIVGLRPIAIKEFKIDGEVYSALQMLNVMVHPAYQGKGLFKMLMEKAWEEHCAEGVLAFTFPNENSIKAYQRWKDWFVLADLPLYIRLVPPKSLGEEKSLARFTAGWPAAAVAALRSAGSDPAGIAVQKIDVVDETLDALWQNNKHLFDCIIPRNATYLRWRYEMRPDVRYAIYKATSGEATVGFLVARTRTMLGMRLGLIVDFFIDNNDRHIMSTLLKRAVADLIDQGVQALGIQYVGPQSLKKALFDNGFMPIPAKLLPRKFLMYARPGLLKNPGLCLSGFGSAMFTWGDNDAV